MHAGHSHTAAVSVSGALWVCGWGGADEDDSDDEPEVMRPFSSWV